MVEDVYVSVPAVGSVLYEVDGFDNGPQTSEFETDSKFASSELEHAISQSENKAKDINNAHIYDTVQGAQTAAPRAKFVPTFYSSFLFIIPLAFALHKDVTDLAIGSFICLITSCVNHGIPNHPIIRPIDIITVNSIAIYFTVIGWFRLHPYYFAAVVAFGSISMIFYLFVAKRYHWNYHVVVHVIAVTGVCIYIHGMAVRKEEFENNGLVPPMFDS